MASRTSQSSRDIFLEQFPGQLLKRVGIDLKKTQTDLPGVPSSTPPSTSSSFIVTLWKLTTFIQQKSHGFTPRQFISLTAEFYLHYRPLLQDPCHLPQPCSSSLTLGKPGQSVSGCWVLFLRLTTRSSWSAREYEGPRLSFNPRAAVPEMTWLVCIMTSSSCGCIPGSSKGTAD